MNRSFRCITLGCKANQVDTQRLRELLLERGWVESSGGAALLLVNTCAVTSGAGRKARKLLRSLRRDQPGARIVVTGCLAEAEPRPLLAIEGVAAVLGNRARESATRFLRAIGEKDAEEGLELPRAIHTFAGHTRAFVKIQDGCDHACSFCIIPRLRGSSRSRAPAELLQEVSALVRRGYREIVLCGIHIGEYGRDLGSDLTHLVELLGDLPGSYRLRLSSIEATEVSAELLRAMSASPRVCHHLHLPLQSGDDAVLRAMNRWYGRAEYLRAIDRIRAHLDQPALSADVIVGFPGEDERAFERTVELLERLGLCRLHVFPFSPRPGTAAERLPGRLPAPALRERRERLEALTARSARSYRRSLLGRVERVVFESAQAGLGDRYQRIAVADGEDHRDSLREVHIQRLEGDGLSGTIRNHGSTAQSPLARP